MRLENLTLRHTDWSLPERLGRPFSQHDDGTLYASAPQAATNIPGAISFENCKRCAVIGCEISHVGTYAVDMVYACHSMQVEKCRMLDLGAGGVKLNGATAQDPGQASARITSVIADNLIIELRRPSCSWRAWAWPLCARSHIDDRAQPRSTICTIPA